MTLRAGAVVFVFLLVGSAGFPQGNQSRRVPQFVYGRWAITKFVEVGGHNQDKYFVEVAKNQELAVYYDGWIFFLQKTTGTPQ